MKHRFKYDTRITTNGCQFPDMSEDDVFIHMNAGDYTVEARANTIDVVSDIDPLEIYIREMEFALDRAVSRS